MIIKRDKSTKRLNIRKFVAPLLLLLGLTVMLLKWGLKNMTTVSTQTILCDSEKVEKGEFKTGKYSFKNGNTQSSEKSFSGKYSSKIDKEHIYGVSYQLDNPPTGAKYTVTIKRWTESASNSALVISAGPNNSYYTQEAESISAEKNGWETIKAQLIIPRSADIKNVKVFPFLLNKNEVAYFDDMKISIVPLSKLKKIKVDKLFLYLDHKALEKLHSKRDKAIKKGLLQSESDDWVKAKLTANDSVEYKIKLRLKGDWTDHLKNEYWSYRIKMPSDQSWKRLMTFSLQDPKTRSFLDEWLYHKAIEGEDVLTPRYGFVELKQNDKKPILYVYEEHFDKQIAEFKNRREGVILKLSDEYLWNQRLRNKGDKYEDKYHNSRRRSDIKAFKESKMLKSPKLKEQFEHAQNLLHAFRYQTLPASEIFDMERMAKYFAITDIFDANHAIVWHNMRFYYNPITRKLEPIGYDGFTDSGAYRVYAHLFFGEFKSSESENEWSSFYQFIFRDPHFNKYYVPAMVKYSSNKYINNLLLENEDELYQLESLIKSYQNPKYKFDAGRIKKRAKSISRNITPYDENSLRSYREGRKVYVTNHHALPLEIVGSGQKKEQISSFEENQNDFNPIIINSNDRKGKPAFTKISIPNDHRFVFYKLTGQKNIYFTTINIWSRAENPDLNYSDKNALKMPINSSNYTIKGDVITILNGTYSIKEPIVIPSNKTLKIEAGTKLDFTKRAYLLSYSTVLFGGAKNNQISITSSDKSSQGIVVISANEKSKITYTSFTNLNTLVENEWQLTGAVTFYESDVDMTGVTIAENHCEDALNIIRSNFNIQHLNINTTYGDGFDCDFCKGKLYDSRLFNTGNDALDFSGSVISVENIVLEKIGDKGISGGEQSTITAINVSIKGAIIGLASKDLSLIKAENLALVNCKDGLAAYRKKPEFGGGKIKIISFSQSEVKRLITKDEESTIILPKEN